MMCWLLPRQLVELGNDAESIYKTMNNFIATSTTIVKKLVLILSASFFVANVLATSTYADEFKGISQRASESHSIVTIDKLHTYTTSDQKNAQALFTKGVLLAERGQRDEAIKTFYELTEKFPALPEPYNNLAVLYAEQGQLDKAKNALETALKTNPSYATAHENLGDIYAHMASVAYDKALQLNSSNSYTQTKLSLIKDLFGPNNKPIITTNEPAKVANLTRTPEIKASDFKKPEALLDKVIPDTPKKSDDKILESVNNWAQAWSTKNLDKYFASYGKNFNPPKGESLKIWEVQRRERINRPEKISVELSNITIKSIDSNNAKVHFKQSYRAGSKPIYTSKTLIMKKSGDNWFIEQEVVGH